MEPNHELVSNALLYSFKDSENIFSLVKIILYLGLSIFNLSGTFDPNSAADQQHSIKQITPEINDSMNNWLDVARSIAELKGFFFSFAKNLQTGLVACESNDLVVINIQCRSLISLIDNIETDLNEQMQKLLVLNEKSKSFPECIGSNVPCLL